MTLTEEQKTALRAIVRAAIDQGAACQKLNSFVVAEPGIRLRSVYTVMGEQAIAAMEAIEPGPTLGSIDELAYFIDPPKRFAEAGDNPAERAKQHPAGFESLSSEDQWAIDRRLGLLDWDGH